MSGLKHNPAMAHLIAKAGAGAIVMASDDVVGVSFQAAGSSRALQEGFPVIARSAKEAVLY